MINERIQPLRRLDELGIARSTFERPPVTRLRRNGIPGGYCTNLLVNGRQGIGSGCWSVSTSA